MHIEEDANVICTYVSFNVNQIFQWTFYYCWSDTSFPPIIAGQGNILPLYAKLFQTFIASLNLYFTFHFTLISRVVYAANILHKYNILCTYLKHIAHWLMYVLAYILCVCLYIYINNYKVLSQSHKHLNVGFKHPSLKFKYF